MANLTFNPPVGPSYLMAPKSDFPVIRFEAEKPYVQIIPKTIRGLRTVPLKWNALTRTQLDYFESFFHELKGSASVFDWALTTPSFAPAHRGPDLEQVSSGSLGQETYYVQYTWYQSSTGQETTASPEESITCNANNVFLATVPVHPTGADQFRIYATNQPGEEELQGASSTRTWQLPDGGLLTGTATAPAVNNFRPVIQWRNISPVNPVYRSYNKWSLELTFQEEHV